MNTMCEQKSSPFNIQELLMKLWQQLYILKYQLHYMIYCTTYCYFCRPWYKHHNSVPQNLATLQDMALHGMITYFYDESVGTPMMQLAKTSLPLDAERSAESFPAWNKAAAYAMVGQCLLKHRSCLLHLWLWCTQKTAYVRECVCIKLCFKLGGKGNKIFVDIESSFQRAHNGMTTSFWVVFKVQMWRGLC